VRLTTTILPPNDAHDEPDVPTPDLKDDAVQQLAREAELRKEHPNGTNGHALPIAPRRRGRIRRWKLSDLVELAKSRKTTQLLLQIWHSDYSIIAFILVMASFYLMKDTRYAPVGLLFFILAMATVDAILSIFVVRLSFHQNKHGFYRTEDFERDWLRYRILLSMTKAALLFVVATSCGTATVVASYIAWFFTATQRLRYIILRWSTDEHYPDLQRWSIFALLREAGIEPKLKNFNIVALLGIVISFAIVFAWT
jgi:hypothetical protein